MSGPEGTPARAVAAPEPESPVGPPKPVPSWSPPLPGWPAEPTGELRLRIARRGPRSIATDQFHRGALRVIRPLHLDDTGQVTYVVVNPGGGYLDGDTYLTEVDVADGAALVLTTQAATKVYRTPRSLARQHTLVRLGAGALLEMVPDQLIAYRGSSYLQTTDVEMDPTATFICLEVITPGWAPDGSTFGYDSVRMRTDVRVGGRVAVVDNLRMVPQDGDVPGPGVMEGHSHLASLTVVDARVDDSLVDRVARTLDVDGVRAGVTRVQGPGFVARALGGDTARLTGLMLDVDALLRRTWFDAPPLSLRKY